MTPDEIDAFDDDLSDGECDNCGGEGYVSGCWDDGGCVDPESGCEACMVRCDWCNPPKPNTPTKDPQP